MTINISGTNVKLSGNVFLNNAKYPTYISQNGAFAAEGSTSVTSNTPTLLNVGDLLVAVTVATNSAVMSPPSGWTLATDQSGRSISYKIANSTDVAGSSYTWTASISGRMSVTILAYRRASFSTVGTISNAGTTTAPGITTSINYSFLLYFVSDNSTTSYAAPPSMTLIAERLDSSLTSTIFYKPVDPGATGGITSPTTPGGLTRAILLAIAPA
jgi:uncharacterized Zn-finger protein